MEVATALNIIDQLQLSRAQKRELAKLLTGGKQSKKKTRTPITVSWAKRDFKERLSKR